LNGLVAGFDEHIAVRSEKVGISESSSWNRSGEDNVSSGRDEPTRRSGVTEAFFPHAAVTLHRELKVKLIGMEACGRSHFLGRALREQGHDVRLIPAQYVKPYVKTNKGLPELFRVQFNSVEVERSMPANQDHAIQRKL